MSSVLARLRSASAEVVDRQQVVFAGVPQLSVPVGSLPGARRGEAGTGFAEVVAQVGERSGVVSAAVAARALLMSEVRFRWHDRLSGRRFGDRRLAVLERPGYTTRPGLLYALEVDVAFAGVAFVERTSRGLRRVRPDRVDVLFSSSAGSAAEAASADDALVEGYVIRSTPRGVPGPTRVVAAGAGMVHWAPEPDPVRPGLGVSWVASVLGEALGDMQVSDHVANYLANAATPNTVITAQEGLTRDQFVEWRDVFDRTHSGSRAAGRSMYVSYGTKVDVVGANLGDLAVKDLQGGFETRVAARSRVPAAVLGIREGMAGSALNAGNYAATRRLWADGWFAPHSASLCAALEPLLGVGVGDQVELSVDRTDVLFLQEDRRDEADILAANASTIETLVRAGFDPTAAVDAVVTGEFGALGTAHSGLVSVQLVPPGGTDGA